MRRGTLPTPGELRVLVLRARDLQEDLASRNAAFNQLVNALQDFAVGGAYVHLRDIGLAEDAAQESFILAWRQLPRLRDPDLFLPWLKRIIASQCHRALRKKSTRFTSLQTDLKATLLPAEDRFSDFVSSKERKELVREALDHLPARERIAVVLFYFSGESHAAIARFLGIPSTTVVKRLASARKRLKSALAPLQSSLHTLRPSRTREFAQLVRAGIYDDYVGLYRFDLRPELTVTVERIANRLVSFSAGQRNTVILGTRLSELGVKEFNGRARFVRGKSGRITHFIYYEFGKRMGIATKVQ